MNALVIDDDAVEVEEDRLNHRLRCEFDFSLLPLGEGLGMRGLAREATTPSPQPSPKGRGSKTGSIKKHSSPSPPASSTHQSFRSALQTTAAAARSPVRPNVEALHSA